ncbi:unnamed protein product [Dibothriocephalus latus]|uniref:Uncharacterized protein n=1 Tax=Dibothriocephalus latus TaxID=60516 RepID=A0A3P7QUP5_DIBLA|nr:unnamed protein product [Dibothriocephalus latus]
MVTPVFLFVLLPLVCSAATTLQFEAYAPEKTDFHSIIVPGFEVKTMDTLNSEGNLVVTVQSPSEGDCALNSEVKGCFKNGDTANEIVDLSTLNQNQNLYTVELSFMPKTMVTMDAKGEPVAFVPSPSEENCALNKEVKNCFKTKTTVSFTVADAVTTPKVQFKDGDTANKIVELASLTPNQNLYTVELSFMSKTMGTMDNEHKIIATVPKPSEVD